MSPSKRLPTDEVHRKRIRRYRRAVFSSGGVEGALVTDLSNIRYLTGFSGSFAFLFLAPRKSVLVTDGRYETQVREEVEGASVRIESRKVFETVRDLCGRYGVSRLGFEAAHVTVQLYQAIRRPGLRLRPLEATVEAARLRKDEAEVAAIRKAVSIAERAFLEVKPSIRPGARECDIAAALVHAVRRRGSQAVPFDPIVAAGRRSALPHARPTRRRLRRGDLVVVDWGAEWNGYFSDMTRTFLLGGGGGEKRRLCDIVLEAQASALRRARPGVGAREVDEAARSVIREAGYGLFFNHGTGHGVGLDVHEMPRVSAQGRGRLEPGMVFTVEPGIYVPTLGGVRIEDMVLMTEEGPKRLTRLPRSVEIL